MMVRLPALAVHDLTQLEPWIKFSILSYSPTFDILFCSKVVRRSSESLGPEEFAIDLA